MLALLLTLIFIVLIWSTRLSDIRKIYKTFFPKLRNKKEENNIAKKELIKKVEKENKLYRYKVKCDLYYRYPEMENEKMDKSIMLSNEIFECPKAEAINTSLNLMKQKYEKYENVDIVTLNQNELYIKFKDGLEYWYKNADVILINDSESLKSLRKLNSLIKELLA